MLNIGVINEGIVLDHIAAGGAMNIYSYLRLEKSDYTVAIIKNAKSNLMGKKDIIKIEGNINIDFDVLGVLDPNITVNVIRDGVIVENIIKCKNPRCITSIEQGLAHRFKLTNREKGLYRCEYCEQAFKRKLK